MRQINEEANKKQVRSSEKSAMVFVVHGLFVFSTYLAAPGDFFTYLARIVVHYISDHIEHRFRFAVFFLANFFSIK